MTLFVTGTDTNIGKTLVSAWLTLHTGAAYYKPIQTGMSEGSDSAFVQNLSQAHIYPEAYTFQDPVSPHLAAHREHRTIDLHTIQSPPTHQVVVEGAGGVFVPLNEQGTTMMDLIFHINAPVLLVARGSLGTLNHTLLTVEALRSRSIPLLGIVMSGDDPLNNREALEHYGRVRVLAHIPTLTYSTMDDVRAQLWAIPCPDIITQHLQ